MKAKDILSVLERRHKGDVFIPECKTGPSWLNNNLRIMDAWVMKRSWSDLRTWAYEIKVSRSDFLRDDKWREYLPYCNEFYFVCPWGLIDPEEVEDPAGLLWITKTGGRAYMKKWILPRKQDIPQELLIHLVMSRMTTARPQDLAILRWENNELQRRIDGLEGLE